MIARKLYIVLLRPPGNYRVLMLASLPFILSLVVFYLWFLGCPSHDHCHAEVVAVISLIIAMLKWWLLLP